MVSGSQHQTVQAAQLEKTMRGICVWLITATATVTRSVMIQVHYAARMKTRWDIGLGSREGHFCLWFKIKMWSQDRTQDYRNQPKIVGKGASLGRYHIEHMIGKRIIKNAIRLSLNRSGFFDKSIFHSTVILAKQT